jgi:hypothetical protein
MKIISKLEKENFGIDEYGFSMFPSKISNVKILRINNFLKMGGCIFCFPHGTETCNSHINNRQRNWKKFRKNQYK